MGEICPLCADDDHLARITLAPNLWQYTCSNARRHPDRAPYTWQSSGGRPPPEPDGGIAEEYGLYDDLPQCLIAGEPWVEYGIVEHRYSQLRPKLYTEMVGRWGHTRQGPRRYTVSAFLGGTLGRLWSRGVVVGQERNATGYWAYNSSISYWALPPAPPVDHVLTYTDYATAIGLDPNA